MPKYNFPEHTVDNVWSAIRLAEELRVSGDYDLFRGQRHTFDIQPSISRAGVNPQAATAELNDFGNWVSGTPDLSSLHGNVDALLAVAQHYGLKTPFLDFSYSPYVAGFFATDGGIKGDVGTIICLNKKRFVESWSDLNENYFRQEGRKLTDIVEIDVRNLWRLQAQEGVFLRSHVDPILLEMFSGFLHIYFPQLSRSNVLEREKIYPTAKSHLEVLLDQYFLIASYSERELKMQEIFGPPIVTMSEETVKQEMETYFGEKALPDTHSSWTTEFANRWYDEPDEQYSETGQGRNVTLKLSNIRSAEEFEADTFQLIRQALSEEGMSNNGSIIWNVVSDTGRVLYVESDGSVKRQRSQYTDFSVSDMVNSIYAGMRYLPYTKHQIARAISRYLTMLFFECYQVIGDAVGIEFSGGNVRGRGFCSERNLRNSLREDFWNLISKEKLDSSGELDKYDLLFAARYVRTSYVFDRLVDLFVEDIIPTQAVIAVEGLVVGLNPFRIDVLGES